MAGHQACLAEYAVNAGGAHGYNVGVQHHERQTPIAFLRVLGVELDDRLLLPLIEPPITGDFGVVLIHLAIAGPPVVELTGRDSQPTDEPP